MRGEVLFSLGVVGADAPGRDGIGILGDTELELDLPDELGDDCLRLLFAVETDSETTIAATVASSATVNLNLKSFIIDPRIRAAPR